MRKILKELHLWLSIPFGVLITVICITGATLIYEDEILSLVQPKLYKVEYSKGAQKLQPSEIVEKLKAQVSDSIAITSIEIYDNPRRAAQARYKGGNRFQSISVNPYTGELNGFVEWSGFFRTMFFTHRWLMNPSKVKGEMSTGKLLTATSTIMLIIITITGLIIWFPRRRSKNYGRIVKNRLKFSVTKGWRRFWYESHLSLGFYSAIIVLIMCLTGLTWSFPEFRKVVSVALGSNDTEQSKVTKLSASNSSDGNNAWDNAYNQMLEIYPEHQSVIISNGKIDVKPEPNSSNSFMRDSYKFDDNGSLTEVQYWKDLARKSKMKSIIYNLHTGSWAGPFVKFIYFLCALIAAILPISGYYLWIKRKFSR